MTTPVSLDTIPDGAPPKPDGRAVILKFRMLALWWCAELLVVAFVVIPLWRALVGGVQAFGEVFESMVSDWEYWVAVLAVGGFLGLMQLAMILPVRKPRATNQRGWPMWLTILAAGTCAMFLLVGLFFILIALMQISKIPAPSSAKQYEYALPIMLGGWVLTSWLVGGALVHRYLRRSLNTRVGHEQTIARISKILFRGSLIELVAVIPVDVMVRRKQDCYCATGTFWAFTVLLSAGLITIGPAILLPILARRRKEWYADRCDVCGYDIASLLKADTQLHRCPECGAGWKASPAGLHTLETVR